MPTRPKPSISLWLISLLALVACGLAGYLLTKSTGGGVAGCNSIGDFDCDAALSSRWSVWLGVPVSLVGALGYGGMLMASLLVGRRSPAIDTLGWRLMETLIPITAGAAAWFIGLQVIGTAPLCLYCLGIHACGLLIAGLYFWHRRGFSDELGPRTAIGIGGTAQTAVTPSDRLPPPDVGVPTLLGITTVVALVGGQILLPPTPTTIDEMQLGENISFGSESVKPKATEKAADDELASDLSETDSSEPEIDSLKKSTPDRTITRRRRNGSNVVSVLNGQLKIDLYEHAVLGSPDAPYVVVELMDYACPHCRELMPLMDEARKRYGDQLAIVILPIPSEVLCNKYITKVRPKARGSCKISRAALAVGMAAPERFEEIHEWLLKQDRLPAVSKAIMQATQLGDEDEIRDAMRSDTLTQHQAMYLELYAQLAKRGASALPCQIVGNTVQPGNPASVDDLCKLWEDRLGIKPIEQ